MFCLIRELIRPYPVTCYGGCRLKTPTRLSIFSEERGKSQECNLAGVLGRDIGYGSDTNIYRVGKQLDEASRTAPDRYCADRLRYFRNRTQRRNVAVVSNL